MWSSVPCFNVVGTSPASYFCKLTISCSVIKSALQNLATWCSTASCLWDRDPSAERSHVREKLCLIRCACNLSKKNPEAVGKWIGRDESVHGSTDVVLSGKRNSQFGKLQCNCLQIWLFGWLDGVFCTSQKSFKRKVSKGKKEHILWKALWQWEPIMKREEKGEGFTFRVELWVWNNCKFAGEKILCFAS